MIVEAHQAPSFSKALFRGEIHQEMVFPYPRLDPAEASHVQQLIQSLGDFAKQHYDPAKVEEQRWVGDDIITGLGERGLLGLYIPKQYGGQGLSQTGYCRVSEEFGRIDATLAVVMGVHQSIGTKGIYLFGSEEQKQRFLPDLASGRKLAGFGLTEPNAGSDASNLQSYAEPQSDGSWKLNGEKRYIGNGSKDVLVTFAKCPGGHIALILEKGMKGLEVGDRFDTLGLRGNDLRRLKFNNVIVPKENVLGEPGQGFHLAMQILNTGRMSLGTGSVGAIKTVVDLALRQTRERQQFGHPLADFEMVREKISWMVSYNYGLESMAYMTTGLVDRGVHDYSLESAMVKVAGTEFLWYAVNRAFQLAGGQAYMRTEPYEKILRDIRIFPIFEGANDVMRTYIALSGLKAAGAHYNELAHLDFNEPLRSLGMLVDAAAQKIKVDIRPDKVTEVKPQFAPLAASLADQVQRLAQVSEKALRQHGHAIAEKQLVQKRMAHAIMDIYAQFATLSRMSSLDSGAGRRGDDERYLGETFCTRAARRVESSLNQVEKNDDDRVNKIADLAFASNGYRYSLYQ